MARLHVWLDEGMTVGMHEVGDSCVGHGGMPGIFILGGAGAYVIVGGGEAVRTLGGGGAVGTGTLGGRSGRPEQQFICGMVRVTVLGAGRANCMILDNCISACVCSLPNCSVGESGCGCWRAAMSFWIERVRFWYR